MKYLLVLQHFTIMYTVAMVTSSIQQNKQVRDADNVHTETSVCINQLQGQEGTGRLEQKIFRFLEEEKAKKTQKTKD